MKIKLILGSVRCGKGSNGSVLAEEADLEAHIFSLAQKPIESTNVQFSTKAAFLPNVCYAFVLFHKSIINKQKNKIMSELKKEHLVYMSDEMYTPIHYKGMVVKQPFFEGKGNHSVAQLEAICEQFKEYVHQQQIIKQNCMKHIVELKFGVEFPQNEA